MDHHEIVAADGSPLAAQVSGRRDPDAPVLLLLAGQANSHRWWTGLREDFDDRWRVVTLDQRGTGASRGPVGEWTTRLFADDAAARPDRVDRMVLACTSPGGPRAAERSAEVCRSLADPDPGRRLATLQRLFHTDAWSVPPEDGTCSATRP